MEPIGTAGQRAVAKADTGAGRVLHLQKLARPAKKTAEGLPVKFDQEADYEIPRRLFSAFKPAVGHREIKRNMRADERVVIEARGAALELALQPFDPSADRTTVNASIAAMLGGFRSMRQEGEDLQSVATVTRAVLREFPAWAITQGCLKIARRETKIDPRYAPNDSQIHEVVQAIVAPYRENMEMAQSLLAASVEQSPKPRPTYDELMASCRADGLMIGGKPNDPRKAAAEFQAANGVSKEQWDAIPDAKR
jgi:hypothetical protein